MRIGGARKHEITKTRTCRFRSFCASLERTVPFFEMRLYPQPQSDEDLARKPSWWLDLGMFVIRLLSVMIFLYYQLGELLGSAFYSVWKGEAWDLVYHVTKLNLPKPEWLAPTFVAVVAVAFLGVLLGFFTRISSIIIVLGLSAVLLLDLPISATATPQVLVLYLCIYLGILCGGAGGISLDSLLTSRKRKKKDEF